MNLKINFFRYASQQKSDTWFQYYYDAIGYPHAEDPKGKSRTISPEWRWRYGEKSNATIPQSWYLLASILSLFIRLCLINVRY